MKEDQIAELIDTMFKISRLMKDKMSYTNDLTHLSILQIQTLIFLNQNKSNSMTDIAENFHIELSSATILLNRLCDRELVERYEDQEDRRLVRVILTKKGKKLLEQAILQRKEKLKNVLSYLSNKEKSELLSILKTLNNKLPK